MKWQSKTLSSINKIAALVTYRSSRKNSGFDPSAGEQTLTQHQHRVDARLFTCPFSTCLPPPSVSFFFFCSVEFPQLFQLFYHYLGIAAWENNAASCFGYLMADTLPLFRTNTFIFGRKIQPGAWMKSPVKVRFKGHQSLRRWCQGNCYLLLPGMKLQIFQGCCNHTTWRCTM